MAARLTAKERCTLCMRCFIVFARGTLYLCHVHWGLPRSADGAKAIIWGLAVERCSSRVLKAAFTLRVTDAIAGAS